METVYKTLKQNFGLNDKHILILTSLEGKHADAHSICKATSIPQGRIYAYLNLLVGDGLVERSHQRPYQYSVPDFRKSLVWFTKKRIDSLLHAQEAMLDRFRQDPQNVTFISSSADYTKTHCQLVTKSSIFRVITAHKSFPYMLYPESLKDFVEVRKVITASRPTITKASPETTLFVYRYYMDALKNGTTMTGIFEKETFDKHMGLFENYFGRERFSAILSDMIQKITKYKLDIFVIDEYSAMEIDFNEKELCLCVNYSGNTNGFHTRSKELASFFNRVFLEKMKRAENVLPLLEEKRKGLRHLF